MTRLLAGLLALCALTGIAFADGLPKRGKIGAPYEAPVAFTWTGAYLDVGGGYSWTGTGLGADGFDLATLQSTGWRIDPRAGFDWQLPNTPTVFGIFAGHSFGESDFNSDMKLPDGLSPDYYAGARLGLAMGRSLLYTGAAYQHAEFGDVDLDGIKGLVGFETYVAPQFTLAVELEHTWYDNRSVEGVKVEIEDTAAMVRGRWRPTLNF